MNKELYMFNIICLKKSKRFFSAWKSIYFNMKETESERFIRFFRDVLYNDKSLIIIAAIAPRFPFVIFHPRVSKEFHLHELQEARNALVSHSAYLSSPGDDVPRWRPNKSPAKLISTTTTTRDNRSNDRFSIVKPGENDEAGVVCQKCRRRRRRGRSVECNTSTPFAASRYDVSGSGWNDAGIRENAFCASLQLPLVVKAAGGKMERKDWFPLFHIFGVRRFQVCTRRRNRHSGGSICREAFCRRNLTVLLEFSNKNYHFSSVIAFWLKDNALYLSTCY